MRLLRRVPRLHGAFHVAYGVQVVCPRNTCMRTAWTTTTACVAVTSNETTMNGC
jgi:hypothetical protein